MAKIGYVRISTSNQDDSHQVNALQAAGCERVHRDVVSGKAGARTKVFDLIEGLAPGDTFVVYRFDRLARSVKQLLDIVEAINAKGASLVSLTENIDTDSAGGRFQLHLFAALAEFERGLIRERTQAGLEAARKAGRKGGRKRSLTPKQVKEIRAEIKAGKKVDGLARYYGVSRTTLYRYLQEE